MNKEEWEDYLKLASEITEKLDNTATYESWLIIQEYVDRCQEQNQKYKEVIDTAKEWVEKKINSCTVEANSTTTDTMCRITIVGLKYLLDILKGVK